MFILAKRRSSMGAYLFSCTVGRGNTREVVLDSIGGVILLLYVPTGGMVYVVFLKEICLIKQRYYL